MENSAREWGTSQSMSGVVVGDTQPHRGRAKFQELQVEAVARLRIPQAGAL